MCSAAFFVIFKLQCEYVLWDNSVKISLIIIFYDLKILWTFYAFKSMEHRVIGFISAACNNLVKLISNFHHLTYLLFFDENIWSLLKCMV